MPVQRVTAVKVERQDVIRNFDEPSQGLHRASCNHHDQLGKVRATADATKPIHDALAQSWSDTQPFKLFVLSADGIADARMRHGLDIGARSDNQQRVVDRDTQPHRMDRSAGRMQAGRQHDVIVLDIGNRTFDVPQAILPAVAAYLDAADMYWLTWNLRFWR